MTLDDADLSRLTVRQNDIAEAIEVRARAHRGILALLAREREQGSLNPCDPSCRLNETPCDTSLVSDSSPTLSFDAVRQFTVAPDRHYKVELRGPQLRFQATGSQFDAQWAARGAKTFLGQGVADKLEHASPQKRLAWGIALSAISGLLIVALLFLAVTTSAPIRFRYFTGFGVLIFALVLGLVMILGGLSGGSGAGPHRHDFTLRLADIASAKMLPVQSELSRRGAAQAARLELKPRTGKPILLSIPTAADLEAAKSAIPRLR